MTTEEFEVWEGAFLAAIREWLATAADVAKERADAALAVWREKRRELVTVDLHAQRVRDDRSIAEGMDNGALQP